MKAPGFFKKHFLLNSLFLLPVVFLGKKSKYAIKSLFLHHIPVSSNKLQIQIAHYIKLSKTIQFNASSTPYLQLFIFSKTIKLYLHTNFSCFQCWKVSQSIYYRVLYNLKCTWIRKIIASVKLIIVSKIQYCTVQ